MGKENGADKMKKQAEEKLLYALFDYQRFENDPILRTLISETENNEYDGKISDDDLYEVNAAGEIKATDSRGGDKRDGAI